MMNGQPLKTTRVQFVAVMISHVVFCVTAYVLMTLTIKSSLYTKSIVLTLDIYRQEVEIQEKLLQS